MTADLHTLSGAYAADALDPAERAQFERHLAACESCQQEVRELQATTAKLATASAEAPPSSLKASVMAEIDQTRQEGPPATAADPAGRPSRRPFEGWSRRLVGVAAAALAVAVVGLGVTVLELNNRLDDAQTTSEQLQDLLAAPDTQTVTVNGPEGVVGRVLVSRAEGLAVLHATGMAVPPADSDYQLWLIRGDEFVPAGILAVDEDGTVTHAVRGGIASVEALGVTVEPDGGSPQPTSEPILSATLAR